MTTVERDKLATMAGAIKRRDDLDVWRYVFPGKVVPGSVSSGFDLMWEQLQTVR